MLPGVASVLSEQANFLNFAVPTKQQQDIAEGNIKSAIF